ncbi:Coiled-coil domain-containing protein [Monoraphidium neglectum]|uniref:Coiled-coil domain-containing protein n=1 Tax=Monoraphidium neglectum TaxID=145388 RepID=A0A0D2L067_9CHLO|nr:Coiled-coil domain-containing protein [Monoraphidium neglectum]KIZ00829.1 Coiled-coil domain-containing protein [Monoraphidium neglectum]|eukprot:XP_013899848.1 Coiled-coil domain-containing protein [Monoraphidium neglectum]
MSSLAAARADNFRYPPDFDPKKHGTLNKYHGQHALRDRARKIDEGILIIRFEVPFNIWCGKCGEHIAKGVRFNAEKKQVGSYHSTKIWAFTMRHHCGCRITIETDPKNAEYVVKDGARRKVEEYDPADAGTVQLPDEAERHALNADPLSRLERSTEQARAAATGRAALAALAADREEKRDGYALNKRLRAQLRASKKEDAALDDRRKQLGLADSITLLPESQDDAQEAALALFAADDGSKFRSSWQGKRRKIMTEGIMPAGGGGGGAAAGSGRGGGGRGGGGRRGGGRGVGPVLSPAAQALAARVVRKGGKGSLPGL